MPLSLTKQARPANHPCRSCLFDPQHITYVRPTDCLADCSTEPHSTLLMDNSVLLAHFTDSPSHSTTSTYDGPLHRMDRTKCWDLCLYSQTQHNASWGPLNEPNQTQHRSVILTVSLTLCKRDICIWHQFWPSVPTVINEAAYSTTQNNFRQDFMHWWLLLITKYEVY